MRGGRKQRGHYSVVACWLALLLVFACNRNADSEEQFHSQATASIRRGDFRAAESLAEKRIAALADQPRSPWQPRYRLVLGEAFINLGRAKEALPLLEKQDSPETSCRSKTVLAKALFRLGRAKDAAAILEEAESCASSNGLKALAPENQLVRSALHEAMNRPQEAEAALQLSLKLAEEQNDTYWQTVAFNNLGYRRIRNSRFDEALPFLIRAEEGFQKLGSTLHASTAQLNIALCASRLGDFDKALATYSKVVEIQEREGLKPLLQASLGEVGNIHAFQGKFSQAIPYYQRALALALEISAWSDASKWAGNLAVAMTNVGNWDQAEKFNEQSIELKRRINDTDSQLNTLLNSATIEAGRERNESAEKLFRKVIAEAAAKPTILWEAHAGLGQLYRRTGAYKKAFVQFDAALQVIEKSQAELTLPEYKVPFLARLVRLYQTYVDALIDRGEHDKALQVADSSRARVLLERLGRGRMPLGRPAADASGPARTSKTIVLSYWLAPNRSFLWLVTPQTRRLFTLPPQSEIESLVENYLAFIQNLRDPLESHHPAANSLYEVLIAPVKDLIQDGASVIVVPDGALHNLNFEMLPVPGKAGYWIEDVTLSVAPSLAMARDPDPSTSLKSILLIGNPESAGVEYPRLPNAATEMRSVERRLSSLQQVVHENAGAEPSVYHSSNPQQFSVIHFAAHATANRERPMESAIVLSPAQNTFKLYARDVAQVPLQAELVTISACRGAGARIYSGEGLVGFTWAFLQAGARHVIAGLWDVSDRSTAELMDRLYEHLSSGKSPATALRESKLALIHSTGNFRKPYYWGPFQVYVGRP